MWRNPKYFNESTDSEPAPRDDGKRLATLPRGDGEELRLEMAEFKGRSYLSLRVWAKGRSDQYFPVAGKGCSIRLKEAHALAEALAAVEVPGTAADNRRADRGPRDRPDWRDASLAPITGGDGAFDEFEGEA